MKDNERRIVGFRNRNLLTSHVLAMFGAALVWWLASAQPALTAPASTFTVNSLNDSLDANPGNNACADSGGNCTLRAAIMEANAHAGLDIIVLPAATIALTLTGAGEDNAVSGDLDLKGTLIISGAGSSASIIDASAIGDRVFHVIGGADVTMLGVRMQDGHSANSGGGILNEGSLTLIKSVVIHNQATTVGGGIANTGFLTVLTCTIGLNTGPSFGGGIYSQNSTTMNASTVAENHAAAAGGGIYSMGQFTATASMIHHNQSDNEAGGIFYLSINGRLVLLASTVDRNSAVIAGGISSSGEMLIRDSTIDSNVADQRGGGIEFSFNLLLDHSLVISNSAQLGAGISMAGSSPAAVITATFSTISGNVAAGSGGGLYAPLDSRVLLHSSTVRSNRAGGAGGGLYLPDTPVVVLVNSTLSGNRADGNGGGIYVGGGSLNGYNMTIAANIANADGGVAGSGGGIRRAAGTVNLSNSILATNVHISNNSAVDDDCSGALGQLLYSLLETVSGCSFNPVNLISGQSPRLNGLANNGGPTQTHALRRDSPAIDAGEPSGCRDNHSLLLTTDQRGAPRPFDGNGNGIPTCDMGAYEFIPPVFLPMILR